VALLILPLSEISPALLKSVGNAVGNAFLSKSEIIPSLKVLPESAYDKERSQHDAALLVNFIDEKTKGGEKVLAICNFDIFSPGNEFVYGIAQVGGRVALISLYRLDRRFYGKPSDQETLSSRAAREAVHELGHTYGLGHCKDEKCVMSFSKDILAVDKKESHFCGSCREILRKRL
jgi:archaemetzincin